MSGRSLCMSDRRRRGHPLVARPVTGRRARPRLTEQQLVLLDSRAESQVGPLGICTVCADHCPPNLQPLQTVLYGAPGQPARSCRWCWETRRVHLLGQRLDREHPAVPLLFGLLDAILEYLRFELRPAHDGDSELEEFDELAEIPPGRPES